MKANFIYLSLIVSAIINAVQTKIRFTAVSPLSEKDDFYDLIRDDRLAKPSNSDTSERKIEICGDILQSPFFHHLQNVDPVNPNDQNFYNELKQKYSDIFKNLYEERNSSKTAKFTNSYRPCNITVSRVIVQESVFSCLARNRKSKEVLEYFVSQEYELQVDNYDEKLGRFVFADTGMKKPTVIALAEEPGETRTTFKMTTDSSLDTSESETQEVVYSCGTINNLPPFQMIRLCTLALSAEEYAKDFIFIPDDDNLNCWTENEEISFEHVNYYRDEWSVVCNAFKIGTEETVKFYLSRNNRDYICRVKGDIDSFVRGISSRIGLNVASEGGVHKT